MYTITTLTSNRTLLLKWTQKSPYWVLNSGSLGWVWSDIHRKCVGGVFPLHRPVCSSAAIPTISCTNRIYRFTPTPTWNHHQQGIGKVLVTSNNQLQLWTEIHRDSSWSTWSTSWSSTVSLSESSDSQVHPALVSSSCYCLRSGVFATPTPAKSLCLSLAAYLLGCESLCRSPFASLSLRTSSCFSVHSQQIELAGYDAGGILISSDLHPDNRWCWDAISLCFFPLFCPSFLSSFLCQGPPPLLLYHVFRRRVSCEAVYKGLRGSLLDQRLNWMLLKFIWADEGTTVLHLYLHVYTPVVMEQPVVARITFNLMNEHLPSCCFLFKLANDYKWSELKRTSRCLLVRT